VGQIGDRLLLLSLATMTTCHNGDMQQMSFTRKAKIIDCKPINEGHVFFVISVKLLLSRRSKNGILLLKMKVRVFQK